MLINLTRDKQAIVDEQDYEYLNQWKWHFDGRYAARTKWMKELQKEIKIYMHKEIFQAKIVDHINGNQLDNRRENLREVTGSQNNMNQTVQKRKKHSKYKGVSWDKSRNKWIAYCKKDGKMYNLGRYESELKAVLVYNQKALELFGEFARLNKI
jgi:hypothetical protein